MSNSTRGSNVMLLVVDSLRADVASDPGIAQGATARAMQRGATFLQCLATASSTTPSFASILTGNYPPRHGLRGLRGYRLSPAVPTMPELFSPHGYDTYAAVTGPLIAETGILRGFATAKHRPATGIPFMSWIDEVLSDLAQLSEPWLSLVHVWEVHCPFRVPPKMKPKWDRRAYETLVRRVDRDLERFTDALPDGTILVVTGDHGEQYPTTLAQRVAASATRKLRHKLKTGRQAPNFDRRWLAPRTAGHGHGLYEHLVRVPLVICGPAVPRMSNSIQVSHVDLLPTLLDLSGLPPTETQGRSLAPAMRDGSLEERPVYMETLDVTAGHQDREIAVRLPNRKLLKRGEAEPAYLSIGAQGEERATPPDESTDRLVDFMQEIESSAAIVSGMSDAEEAIVEKHLQDLGYL